MGPGDLKAMLGGIGGRADARVLVDMASSDDAGVVRLDRTSALVHTIDVITPIVDDPATFGRVAAANAVSDIYAMGGTPTSAVAFLGVPKGLPPRALSEMMSGARELLDRAGALLVGGHTVKDAELKLGFAVTGIVDPRTLVTNQSAKSKQRLLLTKPLGTGVLYAAMKKGVRTAKQTRALVASMTALNRRARDLMVEHRVRCGTDVTGFGLAGHALNLARGSDVDVVLEADRLPMLEGVEAHLAAGISSGTADVNLLGYGRRFVAAKTVPEAAVRLAADPQTSGGILMAVDPKLVARLIQALPAWDIGEIRTKRSAHPTVRLLPGHGR